MGTIVTTSLGTFVTSRRREIALLVGILSGAFTLVSMVGFHASDPTLMRPGSGIIENPCGWVGANLADLVFTCVGYGAWILVLVVAIAILSLAGRRVLSAWQWLGSVCVYVAVLGGLELAMSPMGPHGAGGLIGLGLGQGLELVVGYVGAWLLLSGFVLVLATMVGKIRWSTIVGALVARVERLCPVVARWLWAGSKSSTSLAWSGARSSARWVVGRVGRAGAGGVAVGARMWSALRRGDRTKEQEEETWEDDDGSWEESVLSDVQATEGDDDTVVGGAQRALAEVEWEPTLASEAASGELLNMFPEFTPRQTASVAQIPHGRSQVHDAFEAAGSPVPAARGSREARPIPAVAMSNHPSAVAVQHSAAAVQPAVVHRPSIAVAPPSARPSMVGDQPSAVANPPSMARQAVAPSSPVIDVAPAQRNSAVMEPAVAARSKTRPVSASNVTSGPGVEVHHNAFLDLVAPDDGEAVREESTFELPPLCLLDELPPQHASYDSNELRRLALLLEEKLGTFNVRGKVTGVRPGPVVTIFEFLPDPGIKVSKIAGLSDDLAMALKALRVRIVAPIPGRGVVGIEIPSKTRLTIFLREVLASPEFRDTDAALPCVLGKDVEGRPVVADLAKMPHLLIGGTTGSGKSVGVNGMLMSMLFTLSPTELRLLLVDPKMLEFEMYADIPHLLHPVVTDAKVANQALAWACREMDGRYELLARWSTRNIVNYNNKVERELKDWTRQKALRYAPKGWSDSENLPVPEKLPYIVVVVDELADLMMVAGKEVEESICRIAQKARACGIHLIVATQRPSVDVVTGVIKANLPTRIAFQLRSRHDSRTVLDEIGAENLLGRGDMLYLPPGVGGVKRCHGAFVSDEEVARVTAHLRQQQRPEFIGELSSSAEADGDAGFDAEMQDELYDAAVNVITQNGKASTSMLQRHLKIGYNRAARIIDAMEAAGLVGPADGSRPRAVLVGQL